MTMPPNMLVWTDERIAELKSLHEKGHSARQIANEMTESEGHFFTRNSICGKSARLRLTYIPPHMTLEQLEARRTVRREKHIMRQVKLRQSKTSTKAAKPIVALAPFIASLNIPFADLEPFKRHSSNQCRFIADEPPGPDYFACGNPTAIGAPYCGHCHGTTHYQPGIILSDAERSRRAASARRCWTPLVVQQQVEAEQQQAEAAE